MPKVGVNNEPLFERLMFAYDGSNYRVIKCDGSGNLVAAVLADQNVQARGYGYYAADWRKAPVPFGPSDTWQEKIAHTVSGTSTQTVHGAAVVEGVLRVVTGITVNYPGAATPDIICCATIDGEVIRFHEFVAIADDSHYGTAVWALLTHQDKMTYYIQSPGAGQTAYLYAWGYIMDQMAA